MVTPTTTTASKKDQVTTTKYKAIHIRCFKIYTGKDLCWSLLLTKFQVFNLQLYQKRDSDEGVSLWNYYENVFLWAPPDDCFWKSPRFYPITIDISKGYYQNRFVICYLRSTYGRFMEFLIETHNKGFSCSWTFSASWALPNA